MFILSTWHSAGNQTFITNREEMFHSAVAFVSFWKGNLSVDLSRTGSNEPPLTKKNGVSSKRTFRCRPAFYYSITPFRLLSTLTIVTISSWIMNSNRVHTARSDDTRRRGYVVVRGRQINWLKKEKKTIRLRPDSMEVYDAIVPFRHFMLLRCVCSSRCAVALVCRGVLTGPVPSGSDVTAQLWQSDCIHSTTVMAESSTQRK